MYHRGTIMLIERQVALPLIWVDACGVHNVDVKQPRVW